MMFSTAVLDQHAALVEHGDLLGDHADELHVVLDDDQRLGAVDLAHQLGGLVDLLMRHAGGRLVEQDELGIGRQHEAEFDPLPLTMGELADQALGRAGQADPLQHLVDHALGCVAGMDAARRQPDVLAHAQDRRTRSAPGS